MTVPRRTFIVSPIYLDVESFLTLRERIRTVIRETPAPPVGEVRFVVIDDSGGADAEMAALTRLSDVQIITPPFNLGHQRALVHGLRRLRSTIEPSDVIVTMDGDGEDRPEDLARLLAELLGPTAGPSTVVLARRTSRSETALFKILYLFFRMLFQATTGLVIRTGNFAAFRGLLAARVLDHPHFDLCYSSSLISLNLDVRFVPCPRGVRFAGRSRMGYLKLIRHGVSMMMPFLDRIAIRAVVGFAVILGGSLAGLAYALIGLFLDPAAGWGATLAVATASAVLSFLALCNFVVLFAIHAQAQGQALSSLDRVDSPPTLSERGTDA